MRKEISVEFLFARFSRKLLKSIAVKRHTRNEPVKQQLSYSGLSTQIEFEGCTNSYLLIQNLANPPEYELILAVGA